MTELHITTRERLRKHLTRKRVIAILFTLLAVGTLSYYFEDIKQLFPDLVTLQLYVFNRLSRLTNPAPQRDWVVGLEIDDRTFFDYLKLTGDQDVTDRAFLAELVKTAVKARAAVIALDINLVADSMDSSDDCRREGNRALFEAISRATDRGIPVVLTQGFDYKSMRALRNIEDSDRNTLNRIAPEPPQKCGPGDAAAMAHLPVFVADCLPPHDKEAHSNPFRVRAGFDLAPEDKRKVPLIAYTDENVKCPSFALQVADAYNAAMGWPSVMSRLEEKTEGGQQFVYSEVLPENSHEDAASEPSFLERALNKLDTTFRFSMTSDSGDQYRFRHLSAVDVHENRDNRQWLAANMEHRVVLIGGHRHAHATAEGVPEGQDWVDYHVGPSGAMVGMYVHANYIQGLLDNRTPYAIGRWTGVAIDLGIALFVIAIELLWVEQRWQRFFVLALGAVLLLMTHKIAQAFDARTWLRVLVYLLVLAVVWRVAFHPPLRKRIITLLLAFVVIALVYLTAALLGYGLDVLAVTVILIAHDMYDRHLQKQEHILEHARGTNA